MEPYNLIPFFLSPFVGAIAWHNLAGGKTGLLNSWARDYLGVQGQLFNVDNLYGVIWVTGSSFAPLVYLFVVGSLRRMDPSLEDQRPHHRRRLVRTAHDGDAAAGRARPSCPAPSSSSSPPPASSACRSSSARPTAGRR